MVSSNNISLADGKSSQFFIHSVEQRIRIPLYFIQTGQQIEASNQIQSPINIRDQSFALYSQKPRRICLLYSLSLLVIVFVCLAAVIGLLTPLIRKKGSINHCPDIPCSSVNLSPSLPTITDFTFSTGFSNHSYSSLWTTSLRKRSYGEICVDHDQCTETQYLFCQYEYDPEEKRCYCETSHFWNVSRQRCEPKKDINQECQYDFECRLDMGITCDPRRIGSSRRCRCQGDFYWSKMSNCGDLRIQDFVHCLDQQYISSCLIREIKTGIYHNVNIRQIEHDNIDFEYFLVDTPDIEDVERFECSWSANRRFCFGIDSEAQRILIMTISLRGVESYRWINQSVIGLPNVLTLDNGTVICYIESTDSRLLSIQIDPRALDTANIERRGEIYSDRSCFIAENMTIYCFYRDLNHHLVSIQMSNSNVSHDIYELINRDNALKTDPSCGWLHADQSMKILCFAVFPDEQIHMIEHLNGRWSSWRKLTSETLFIQRPFFVTSKVLSDNLKFNQSCHVLAIDTSNQVYVNTNRFCVRDSIFSNWALLQTDVGLLSFNGSFHLRDGRLGIYGVGIDDLPYYTILNSETHQFQPIQLAITNP